MKNSSIHRLFTVSMIVMTAIISFLSCESDKVIIPKSISVGNYPKEISKEGGSFTVDVQYEKAVQFFTYGEEIDGTEFIRTNLTKDTLESNWYKATITHEKVKKLSVEIYPNETKLPREGSFYIVGTDEYSSTHISFSQSDR